jgi:hypothetical protein
MTRAVEAELRAESATSSMEQECLRAEEAERRFAAAEASSSAQKAEARKREEELKVNLHECERQRGLALRVC